MDIYVLHDGKEIGPLSPEKTWHLVNQGTVLTDDLAWSPGMPKWEPLSTILPPADSLPPAPAPAPAPIDSTTLDPATPKQRALLAFLHIGFTRSTTKTEAALLISDALENPAFTVRLAQWPAERLKLHGDLFVAELQAKRENRAHHYLSLAQSEGAALFTGVTRTHAQSIITHLDMERPGWEANESTAAREHFFPALAEKFPQLVRPDAQGRSETSSARKLTPDAPSPARKKSHPREPRGPFPFGAIARGLFFGGLLIGIGWFVMKVLDGGTPAGTSPDPAPAASLTTPPPAETTEPPPTPPPATPAPEPTPSAPTATPAPMAETPAPTPAPTAPEAPPNPPPAAPAAPTTVQLTKPYEAQFTYGKVTLPAGTTLRLIGQEGVMLRVQHLNSVLLIPASATNHAATPAPTPGL